MSPAVTLGAALASAALFILAAWATRARPRRIVAALVGGVLAALVNVGWDLAAFQTGWWRYADGEATAGWAAYIPVALWIGGGMGLIGWRMIRAWRSAGAVAFMAAFTALGSVRDQLYSARGDIFSFGPGPWPLVADAAGWLSLAAVVQLTLRGLAGSARTDALARS